ncbi:proline racemase family protein [Salinicoccus siamensis]|uniref:Proline racemase family protein n=1 Tax=Salinicoccus siamensis TaxID=381830 RepID=A0ABV5Z2A5_9STAP
MNFKRMINTIDMHVAGEPLRIIMSGLPTIKGETQLERRAYCIEHLDGIRNFLMNEPRGHEGMYGCIITPPAEEGSDFGVLFMHNEGWSTMCGHGIIAVVTVMIETGACGDNSDKRRFVIDSPAGKVIAQAQYDADGELLVTFENVPSFVYLEDITLDIEGKQLNADVVFGGAFYVFLNNSLLNLTQRRENLTEFKNWGAAIKAEVEKKYTIQHPLEEDLNGIYGVIFSEELKEPGTWQNVTIFADKQIDRSPCGTGTSAKAAQLFNDSTIGGGDAFMNRSITGGIFKGEVTAETKVGEYEAVIAKVSGKANTSGFHTFVLEASDEMPEGFLLQ